MEKGRRIEKKQMEEKEEEKSWRPWKWGGALDKSCPFFLVTIKKKKPYSKNHRMQTSELCFYARSAQGEKTKDSPATCLRARIRSFINTHCFLLDEQEIEWNTRFVLGAIMVKLRSFSIGSFILSSCKKRKDGNCLLKKKSKFAFFSVGDIFFQT